MAVGDMFARRANASEGSFAREIDKEQIMRLKERLTREGWIKPKEISNGGPPGVPVREPSVDVLAEIAANQLPFPKELGSQYGTPQLNRSVVVAPTPGKSVPVPAGHTQVMADTYQQHLGKGKWFNSIVSVVEPQLQAVPAPMPRAPSRLEAARLERSAQAAAAATSSFIVGSVFCVLGAAFAGTLVWYSLGREHPDGMRGYLEKRMPEKFESLRSSPLGQSTIALGKSAETTISESHTLKDFSQGIQRQFGPRT